MRILLDTNLLLDYLTEREPFYQAAYRIVLGCKNRDYEGIVAAHSIVERETGNKKSDREAGFFYCVVSAKQSQGGVVGCHRVHLRLLREEEELLLRIVVLEFARGLCHVGAVARRRGGREVFFLRDEVR